MYAIRSYYGMLLAVIVFMQRLIEVSEISNLKTVPQDEDPDSITLRDVPPCIEVYEINGPFFFGIADKFKSTLNVVAKRKPSAIILRMRNVPIIDATGRITSYNVCYTKLLRNSSYAKCSDN